MVLVGYVEVLDETIIKVYFYSNKYIFRCIPRIQHFAHELGISIVAQSMLNLFLIASTMSTDFS
jgi:hypothetical protein